MGNHMEPSKKIHFCSQNDLFHNISCIFVNIKEPKTTGTTWNHLKNNCSKINNFDKSDKKKK